MPTNKDIKEIMEARKAARRAIPQTDPAEVVAQPPEPELAGPPEVTPEPSVPIPAAEEESKETSQQPSGPAAVVEPDDPRTQPPPADDPYTPTTLRIKNHHRRQLKAESYYKDLLMQDILETALDEYFKKRYGRKGRG
jgi:hypothetical protein